MVSDLLVENPVHEPTLKNRPGIKCYEDLILLTSTVPAGIIDRLEQNRTPLSELLQSKISKNI